jgi:hypothetical protein
MLFEKMQLRGRVPLARRINVLWWQRLIILEVAAHRARHPPYLSLLVHRVGSVSVTTGRSSLEESYKMHEAHTGLCIDARSCRAELA